MTINLYIGVDPATLSDNDEVTLPSFSAEEMIPLGWYLLFSQSSILENKTDGLEKNNQLKGSHISSSFSTTIESALNRLEDFRKTFQEIPYLWSYFRVLDILKSQIKLALNSSDQHEEYILEPDFQYPDKKRSGVKIVDEIDAATFSPPSSEVKTSETLFTSSKNTKKLKTSTQAFSNRTGRTSVFNLVENEFGINENELIDAFKEIDEFSEKKHDSASKDKPKLVQPSELPIVLDFEESSELNYSEQKGSFIEIIDFFDRLLHHIKRNPEQNRIIIELMQDIFRISLSKWRPTGQLSEDFLRSDVKLLQQKTLGIPSPFVILNETFDLNYWTNQTLQSQDERIMYKLSMLATEEIHKAVQNGKLEDIIPNIKQILTVTNQTKEVIISERVFRLVPYKSNLWGIRILVTDSQNRKRPASLLAHGPYISWEEQFKKDLNLPSIRQDWHLLQTIKFDDFLDEEVYTLEFKGAKSKQDAFTAFIRWIRRGQKMYLESYGTVGTIMLLSNEFVTTKNKVFARNLFNILSELAGLGFNSATEALSKESVIETIKNLYSDELSTA